LKLSPNRAAKYLGLFGVSTKEVSMKILPFLILTGVLAVGACNNSTEPTKANTDTVNKNPPIDQNVRPKSTTGGEQPATAAGSK
jgi:hypothetical protein